MASDEAATKHATLQAERMQQVCEAFLAQDALAVIVGLKFKLLAAGLGKSRQV